MMSVADQPVLYCGDRLGDDSLGKYAMSPGCEIGSHECFNRLLCENSPGMRQLEKSEAVHRVAFDFAR